MTSPLIKPPHAISIWVDKEILYAELPNPEGVDKQAHTLRLPLNVFGLTKLVNILHARVPQSRIGEKGDPTQFQVDRDLKELAKGIDPTKVKRIAPAVATSPEARSRARDIIRRIFA